MAQASGSISEQIQQLAKPVVRAHYIIFVVILLAMIGMTVFTVTNLLTQKADPKYEQELNAKRVADNFEGDATIEKIDQLEFSSSNSDIYIPVAGRINPFAEY